MVSAKKKSIHEVYQIATSHNTKVAEFWWWTLFPSIYSGRTRSTYFV